MKSRLLTYLLLLVLLGELVSSVAAQGGPNDSGKAQSNSAGAGSSSTAKESDRATSHEAASEASSTTSGNEPPKGKDASTAAVPSISPATLDFADVEAGGQSAPQYVTVSNNTKGDLSVSKVESTGDFSVDPSPLPQDLKPGESLSFAIRFAPKQDAAVSGTLTITPSTGSALHVRLTGSLPGAKIWLCSISHRRECWFMCWVALAYWLAMVTVRWHRVAKPTREFLRAEIASMRADLDMLPDTSDPSQPDASPQDRRWRADIGALLEDASRLMSPGATDKSWASRAGNFLLWSRGDEMTGWGYVYEADIKMAAHLPLATAWHA